MGLLEREKKYPMIFDIPILLCPSTRMSLTSHFCYAETYRCHTWLTGNSGEMVIKAFLSGFLSHSHKKKVIRVLSIRDNSILLITNKSDKAHLLSCAERCSSKLQMIQSLEKIVSMAIKGTQVPMYTKTHYFCIFFWFLNFYFYFYIKNKINKNWK